jgi:hypothetical protein
VITVSGMPGPSGMTMGGVAGVGSVPGMIVGSALGVAGTGRHCDADLNWVRSRRDVWRIAAAAAAESISNGRSKTIFYLSTDVEQNVASRGDLHVDVGHGARFLGSSGEIHHCWQESFTRMERGVRLPATLGRVESECRCGLPHRFPWGL